jgi:hypothetical protein
MKRHRPPRAACCGFVLLVLASACGGASSAAPTMSRPHVAEVTWRGLNKYGIADLTVQSEHAWLATVAPALRPNLFRVTSGLAVQETRVPVHFTRVFSGGGQLWGIDDSGLVRFVRSQRTASTGKRLPPRCRVRGGAVFQGNLWLACDGTIVAYAPQGARPVRAVRSRSFAVLAARRGLWAVDGRVLHAIAGADRGQRIVLPSRSVTLLRAAKTEIWGVDFGGDGPPAFVRVRLSQRVAQRIPARTLDPSVNDLAIVGDEIWVTGLSRCAILRHRRNHPQKKVGEITLPGRPAQSDCEVTEDVGGRFVWALAQSGTTFHLFQIMRP